MNALFFAVQLLLAAPAPAAEAPVKPTAAKLSPAKTIAAALEWTPPAGWDASDYANAGGADPVVSYEHGLDRIVLRIYGAPGSSYKTPAAFMAGPAATTMGRAPERAGSEMVGELEVAAYRHKYPVPEGDPHVMTGKPPRMAREVFCVLPPLADGRFVVLSYARESAVPDLKGVGDKAWKKFLAGVKLPSRAKPKR